MIYLLTWLLKWFISTETTLQRNFITCFSVQDGWKIRQQIIFLCDYFRFATYCYTDESSVISEWHPPGKKKICYVLCRQFNAIILCLDLGTSITNATKQLACGEKLWCPGFFLTQNQEHENMADFSYCWKKPELERIKGDIFIATH